MISIAKHIEILLLDHDCVVIPEFGGFITSYVSSETQIGQDEKCLYSPPCRTIRFNPALRTNDGVLVQSYMLAYDATYIAAEKQLELDVNELCNELDSKGSYSFPGIGVIHRDLYGNLSFEASDSYSKSPSLYGLPSLELKPYALVAKENVIKEELGKTTILPVMSENLTPAIGKEETQTSAIGKGKSGTKIKAISNRLVDISISAAAAVLLFLSVSYPAMTHTDMTGVKVAGPVAPSYNYSQTVQNKHASEEPKVIDSLSTKLTNAEKSYDVLPEHAAESTAELEAEKEQTPCTNDTKATVGEKSGTKNTASTQDTKHESSAQIQKPELGKSCFTIVLASYVSKVNAEEYIANLKKAGFSEGRYEKTKSVSRILYSKYQTKEQAQSALNKLRAESESFAEAWVMEN